jgi:hypothetical protein
LFKYQPTPLLEALARAKRDKFFREGHHPIAIKMNKKKVFANGRLFDRKHDLAESIVLPEKSESEQLGTDGPRQKRNYAFLPQRGNLSVEKLCTKDVLAPCLRCTPAGRPAGQPPSSRAMFSLNVLQFNRKHDLTGSILPINRDRLRWGGAGGGHN